MRVHIVAAICALAVLALMFELPRRRAPRLACVMMGRTLPPAAASATLRIRRPGDTTGR